MIRGSQPRLASPKSAGGRRSWSMDLCPAPLLVLSSTTQGMALDKEAPPFQALTSRTPRSVTPLFHLNAPREGAARASCRIRGTHLKRKCLSLSLGTSVKSPRCRRASRSSRRPALAVTLDSAPPPRLGGSPIPHLTQLWSQTRSLMQLTLTGTAPA